MRYFSVEEQIAEIVKMAVVEDVGYGDITTMSVIGDEFIEAKAKSYFQNYQSLYRKSF